MIKKNPINQEGYPSITYHMHPNGVCKLLRHYIHVGGHHIKSYITLLNYAPGHLKA